MDDRSRPAGFVSLKSIKQGQPDATSALADIRRIYFKTTKQTIEHDLAHAIELLKSLPAEEEREKATVFMQGLAELRKEWAAVKRGPRTGKTGGTVSQTGQRGKRGRTDREPK